MFGTFRKHQTWLWVVIIGVTIVSMVGYFGTTGSKNPGTDRGGANYGSIDGKPVTETEFQNAWREVSLLYFFSSREWPDSGAVRNGFDQERETYIRILLNRKLDEYHVQVDKTSVALAAANALREFGNGQPISFDFFAANVLGSHASKEDFERFLEHDLAIKQLVSVLGISGGVMPPGEIEELYRRVRQELDTEAVFFSASNYMAQVQMPSPELLGEFYTNQMSVYREPDRRQLSYVMFNITNYFPEAEQKLGTNLDRIVDENLRRIGTNYLSLGAQTPEEAKPKIRQILIAQQAGTNANAQALDFQRQLSTNQPLRLENLATLAKEKGLEVKVTKPFDIKYGPSEFHLGPNFPALAFRLTPEEPFMVLPIRGEDGVYIVALNKEIPSRIPPLEEIHDRVVGDYKYVQAHRIAEETGQHFRETATNQMAQGKTFAAICAEAKIKPADVPPFSVSTQKLPEVEDHIDLRTYQTIALTTPVGKISDFNPTREGGVVVYVRQKLPLDQAKMKAEMPAFANSVRQQRESEAFNLWFGREAQSGLRDIPALRPKQPALR
jgi:hypothetical protein